LNCLRREPDSRTGPGDNKLFPHLVTAAAPQFSFFFTSSRHSKQRLPGTKESVISIYLLAAQKKAPRRRLASKFIIGNNNCSSHFRGRSRSSPRLARRTFCSSRMAAATNDPHTQRERRLLRCPCRSEKATRPAANCTLISAVLAHGCSLQIPRSHRATRAFAASAPSALFRAPLAHPSQSTGRGDRMGQKS